MAGGRADKLTRQLLSTRNLLAATARAIRGVREFEGVYDEDEVLHAENDPLAVIEEVRALLQRLDHAIPCNLVPIPKADRRARAYYWIPLRYQVGWIAILQVLGPPLDKRMPNWSFGYRLRRTRLPTATGTWLWDEFADGGGGVYLGFAQSWKPFRRYINIAMRRMLGGVASEDDAETSIEEADAERLTQRSVPMPGEERSVDMRHYRVLQDLPFGNVHQPVWYAKLDLSKFFASVGTAELAESWVNEVSFLFPTAASRSRWLERLRAWLRFEDTTDTTKFPSLARERLAPPRGLPVGLVASGFVANLAALPIDRDVDAVADRSICMFRYVDDHVVLASTRADLLRFVGAHLRRLHRRGFALSWDKLDPAPLRRALAARLTTLRTELNLPSVPGDALAAHFDPDRPAVEHEQLLTALCDWLETGPDLDPGEDQRWLDEGALTEHQRREFVSTTLQRMSLRADEEVELLDETALDEREADLLDLAHPGSERTHELRHDTLVAFAAGQLVRTPLGADLAIVDAAEPPGRTEAARGRAARAARAIRRAVVLAPQKHRLLDRLFHEATRLSAVDDTGRAEAENLAGPLVDALRDGHAPVDAFHLPDGDPDLRAALWAFLRTRMWQALGVQLSGALRALAPVEEVDGRGAPVAAAGRRALDFLLACARRLAPLATPHDAALIGPYRLESAAARWAATVMALFGVATAPAPTRMIVDLNRDTAAGIARRVLRPLAGAGIVGPLGERARSLLGAWLDRRLRSDRPLRHGELVTGADYLETLAATDENALGAMHDEITKHVRAFGAEAHARLRAWIPRMLRQRGTSPASLRRHVHDAEALDRLARLDRAAREGHLTLREACDPRWMAAGDPASPTAISERYLLRLALGVARAVESIGQERWRFLNLDSIVVDRRAATRLLAEPVDPDEPADGWVAVRDVWNDDTYVSSSLRGTVGRLVLAILLGEDGFLHLRARRGHTIGAQAVWDAFDRAPARSSVLVAAVASLIDEPHRPSFRARARALAALFGVGATRTGEASQALATALKSLSASPGHPGLIDIRLPGDTGLPPSELPVFVCQPNVPVVALSSWRIAPGYVGMEPTFARRTAWPAIVEALATIHRALPPVPRGTGRAAPRDVWAIAVLPELVLPRSKISSVLEFAQRSGVVVVCGVEYRIVRGVVFNEALVAVPTRQHHPRGRARAFWVAKHHPMHEERAIFKKAHLTFGGGRDFPVVTVGAVGSFAVAICYDLYAVETIRAYQRRVQHFLLPAANKDLATFDGLSEAAMRLVFGNVVVANVGQFGGSLTLSPYYDPHARERLRLRGNEVRATIRVVVPAGLLAAHQQGPERQNPCPHCRGECRFKRRPADW